MRLMIPDTRQFRASHEVCLDVSDPKFAFGVYKEACATVAAPERSMLGRPQEIWLEDRLKYSTAEWNVIGTTVMMTPFDMDHNGEALPLSRLLGHTATRRTAPASSTGSRATKVAGNPISLSGDIHSVLVSNVVRKVGDAPETGHASPNSSAHRSARCEKTWMAADQHAADVKRVAPSE